MIYSGSYYGDFIKVYFTDAVDLYFVVAPPSNPNNDVYHTNRHLFLDGITINGCLINYVLLSI